MLKKKFHLLKKKKIIISSEIEYEERILQTLIFNIKDRIKMDERELQLAHFNEDEEVKKQLTKLFANEKNATKKGNWLELKSKDILETLGATVTISKAQYWLKPKENENFDATKHLKVIGDNGIDGIGEIKVGNKIVKFVIQCKCYNAKNEISTDVPRSLLNVLDSYPDRIGILITAFDNLNERAENIIKNARRTVLHIPITHLQHIREFILAQELKFQNSEEIYVEGEEYCDYKEYHQQTLIKEAKYLRKGKISTIRFNPY